MAYQSTLSVTLCLSNTHRLLESQRERKKKENETVYVLNEGQFVLLLVNNNKHSISFHFVSLCSLDISTTVDGGERSALLLSVPSPLCPSLSPQS